MLQKWLHSCVGLFFACQQGVVQCLLMIFLIPISLYNGTWLHTSPTKLLRINFLPDNMDHMLSICDELNYSNERVFKSSSIMLYVGLTCCNRINDQQFSSFHIGLLASVMYIIITRNNKVRDDCWEANSLPETYTIKQKISRSLSLKLKKNH